MSLTTGPTLGRLSRRWPAGSPEPTDSLSSGGEDDDDDQFDFFTAESLFGSLMDRMKSLTKRMEDNPAKVGVSGVLQYRDNEALI